MSTTAHSNPTTSVSRPPAIASETLRQVQSLARRLQAMLATEQAGGHVVGVTSCSRHEGVSVVAGNLAVCAADLYAGKVLLVDANPRHTSVANRFGVSPAPGLADCISGDLAIHECLAATAHPNLSVLPAGSSVVRSARFSAERATEMFDNLRQDFELIVIDLPPTSDMDEALLASQLVDGFLLVLEAERVRRQVALRVKRQLEQVNARLLGVVLNKRRNHIPEWLYHRL